MVIWLWKLILFFISVPFDVPLLRPETENVLLLCCWWADSFDCVALLSTLPSVIWGRYFAFGRNTCLTIRKLLLPSSRDGGFVITATNPCLLSPTTTLLQTCVLEKIWLKTGCSHALKDSENLQMLLLLNVTDSVLRRPTVTAIGHRGSIHLLLILLVVFA